MPARETYLQGFVQDLTGETVALPTPVVVPAPAPAPVDTSRPVTLDVRDLHVNFRAKRPASALVRRFLKSGKGSERVTTTRRGSFEVHALRGVSLTLREGEHVGLVGINGSGKTTLLRTIAGVLPPVGGHVQAPENLCALLSISAGFDQELSGYENLKVRALYSGFPTSQLDAFVEDIMEFSGLGEFFFMPIKSYSAGMKARFALGVATLGRPNLLIMDEWVGAGDMEFRARAHDRLKDFVSSSGALLIASHSYAILQAWVTRLIWLHEGKVMADGPRDDVFKAYSSFLAERR